MNALRVKFRRDAPTPDLSPHGTSLRTPPASATTRPRAPTARFAGTAAPDAYPPARRARRDRSARTRGSARTARSGGQDHPRTDQGRRVRWQPLRAEHRSMRRPPSRHCRRRSFAAEELRRRARRTRARETLSGSRVHVGAPLQRRGRAASRVQAKRSNGMTEKSAGARPDSDHLPALNAGKPVDPAPRGAGRHGRQARKRPR